jgi:cysteine-rich repeat protein
MHHAPRFAASFGFVSFLVACACACSSGLPPEAAPKATPIEQSDLGETCPLIGPVCPNCASATGSDFCPKGYCASGSTSLNGYCSAKCDDLPCPSGYECIDAKIVQALSPDPSGPAKKLCMRKPEVVAPVQPKCGDAKVDPGETCDDGNTKDTDACNASCTRANPPRVKVDMLWQQVASVTQPAATPGLIDALIAGPVFPMVPICNSVDAVRDSQSPGEVTLYFVLCSPDGAKLTVDMAFPDVGRTLLATTLSNVRFRDADSVSYSTVERVSRDSFVEVEAPIQSGSGIKGRISILRLIQFPRGGGNYIRINGSFEVVPRIL